MPVVEPQLIIEREEKPERSNSFFWNLLSFLLVAGMILFVAVFILIFQNPEASINPFPPPTMPATVVIPTATSQLTDAFIPPVTTQAATSEPTATQFVQTLPPTAELPIITMPSATPEGNSTQVQTTPTSNVVSVYPFALQSQPYAIQAEVLYPERNCDWLGVGGQVLDIKGAPYTGITIQLGGYIDGHSIFLTSLTGTALQYGQAGYEFTIADKPIASKGDLWLRLVDQAGLALSERVYFETFDNCQQNLIVINFKQVK
ncbi:MAG TPA: hypothetical protein PLY85_06905 [Anaerolineaceae bacterium]|nr:hypothetical protein [Anaerolineaceae bacterium]